MESLASGPSRANQALSAGSDGRSDLGTLAYPGMMAITITQALRGQLPGPAVQLLSMP